MLGKFGVALGLHDFLDTDMLVLAMRKSRIVGLPNSRAQCKGVCVSVEYRLKGNLLMITLK